MERIVDIATDGRHLSALRGFLVVSEGREEVGRIPLDDIAAVIVHAHGVTFTTSLIVALATRGSVMVLCANNHAPVAVCLPLEGHHAQNARMRAQWDASKPHSKQIWRDIVVAKIRWQSAALNACGIETHALESMARRVGSGDPENIEAQAARRYWPMLMGQDFRRDRQAEGVNAMLNYGYTILRSLCARAVVASGLHPAIGVHHANRSNAFALADDIMEPLRPLVDVLTLFLNEADVRSVTPEAKRAYAGLIAFDLMGDNGLSTVSLIATRMAQDIAASFVDGNSGTFSAPQAPTALHFNLLRSLVP